MLSRLPRLPVYLIFAHIWRVSVVFSVGVFFDLRDEGSVLEPSRELGLVVFALELDFNLLRPRVLDLHAESGLG